MKTFYFFEFQTKKKVIALDVCENELFFLYIYIFMKFCICFGVYKILVKTTAFNSSGIFN